mgnify:CR=1 FL=1
MPRGDSISINDTNLSNGAAVVFGPASGVQWNIKFATAGNPALVLTTAGGDSLNTDLWAGNTTESSSFGSLSVFSSRINWVLTNSQKMRFQNNTSIAAIYSYYGTDMGSDPSGIGSVISQTALSNSSGSNTALRPSSGQEWFLFWWGSKHSGGAMFRWLNTNDQIRWELEASNTTHVNAYGFSHAGPRVRMHLTNSVYVRVRNEAGATSYYTYHGIRTK